MRRTVWKVVIGHSLKCDPEHASYYVQGGRRRRAVERSMAHAREHYGVAVVWVVEVVKVVEALDVANLEPGVFVLSGGLS